MAAHQAIPQLGEGVAAVQRQAQRPFFQPGVQHVGGLLLAFPQVESEGLEVIALGDSALQIFHRAYEADPRAAGHPNIHHQAAQLIQQKLPLLVVAVGSQRKLHEAEGLIQKVVQFGLRLHDGGQLLHVGAFAFGKLASLQRQSMDLFNILLQVRVVKAVVEEGEIPFSVCHDDFASFPFKLICSAVRAQGHSRGRLVSSRARRQVCLERSMCLRIRRSKLSRSFCST